MTSDLHDLTDRELYRLSFDIAEVLVARAKCRLAGEAGVPAPVAMARRMAQDSVGGDCAGCGRTDPSEPGYSCEYCGAVTSSYSVKV